MTGLINLKTKFIKELILSIQKKKALKLVPDKRTIILTTRVDTEAQRSRSMSVVEASFEAPYQVFGKPEHTVKLQVKLKELTHLLILPY